MEKFMKIAEWTYKLKKNYLFQSVAEKVKSFKEKNPSANIINMGIGDVSLPICKSAVNSCIKSANEMGNIESFRGYSPNGGYDFLKKKYSKRLSRQKSLN